MSGRRGILLLAAVAACSPRTPAPAGEPAPSEAVSPADREGALVTLERTPCFGSCPVYQVSIAGDGTVEFVGRRFVARLGSVSDRTAPERVDTLLQALVAGGYFGFADRYVPDAPPACGAYATDAPTVITSVTAGGRTKTIRHDYGCSAAPAELTRLERLIDETAGTGRWTGR